MVSPQQIARLVEATRRFMNHDAGDDEPQDLYEIEILTREFSKILCPKKAGKP